MSRLARLTSALALLGTVLWVAAPAAAQESQQQVQLDASPAHISVVDGTASLERDGRSESSLLSMPLLAGDRVRTQAGRVEILFGDGSTLHLDNNTLVDFQSDEVIRLLEGRVRVNIAGASREVAYRVDAPSAWVEITRPGEYRIAVADGKEIELAVLRGAAELVNEDGRSPLGAGERAFARVGAAPSSAYVFNSAAWDAFDRWSEERRDARIATNAQYLPETVQPYAATFDQYGSWQSVPTYGYVWYPRVRPGWRPYYYGRWTTLRPWGWTWIGSDPWAWPTHHYGRWGFAGGSWFWIPGRTWSAAWVSWAYAPGYVSWCPLGWDNRPVFSFINVNVFGGRRYDRWHAWTVVPHGRFGRGFVNVNVINATRIDVRTRNAFSVRNAAPDFRGYAVPRSNAPIRTAVSRNGAFGGNSAFRGSPRVTTGARGDVNDAAATFRNRRSSGGSLTGPGYPPAARSPERAAPSRERGSVATPSGARERSAPARSREPGTASEAASPGPLQRRAVPRSAPSNTAPSSTAPARRVSPDSRSDRPAPAQAAPDQSGATYRAVPRERRGDDLYAPSRSYGVQRERSARPAPAAEAPRPSPAPRADAPPPGYRSREGGYSRAPSGGQPSNPGRVERSAPRSGMDRPAPAPSRPSPSAAPSGGSERSSGSGGGGNSGSRSRGGGASSGRSAPRGRS